MRSFISPQNGAIRPTSLQIVCDPTTVHDRDAEVLAAMDTEIEGERDLNTEVESIDISGNPLVLLSTGCRSQIYSHRSCRL